MPMHGKARSTGGRARALGHKIRALPSFVCKDLERLD